MRKDTYAALDLVPVLSTAQALSFGRVDWKHNFWQGMRDSFSFDGDYALTTGQWDRLDQLTYVVQGELSSFLTAGKKVGLSIPCDGVLFTYSFLGLVC